MLRAWTWPPALILRFVMGNTDRVAETSIWILACAMAVGCRYLQRRNEMISMPGICIAVETFLAPAKDRFLHGALQHLMYYGRSRWNYLSL